ncbi:GDP-mannose 4,6-dehydratase [Candidatus Woesearchaeota archaeon]|nr:GDP-mannose 4,6-dehydratase [Candidatus Woesearchaeota archaeon]
MHAFPSLAGARILITGGLGFIGSNLAQYGVAQGAQVTLLTNQLKTLANIREIKDKVEILQGDITNYHDLTAAVKSKDIIFHLAGQTSGITSMEDPWLDIRANLTGTMNILENCRVHNDQAQFVTTGSITQAGPVQSLPITGDERDNPLSIYEVNKMVCEKYAMIYHRAYGFSATCLRLATLYGERQQLTSPRFGITNYFIGRIFRNEPIIIYDKGEFYRDYLYVGDVINALLLAASKNASGKVFPIGTNRKTKFIAMVQEVIAAMQEIAGIAGSYRFVEFPAEHRKVDVGDSQVDYRKFHEATGWEPKIMFPEGIRKTIAFYQKRRLEYL